MSSRYPYDFQMRNESNYIGLLPRVVAEIWSSYLEGKLGESVKNEKILRPEAELELDKLKSAMGVHVNIL